MMRSVDLALQIEVGARWQYTPRHNSRQPGRHVLACASRTTSAVFPPYEPGRRIAGKAKMDDNQVSDYQQSWCLTEAVGLHVAADSRRLIYEPKDPNWCVCQCCSSRLFRGRLLRGAQRARYERL